MIIINLFIQFFYYKKIRDNEIKKWIMGRLLYFVTFVLFKMLDMIMNLNCSIPLLTVYYKIKLNKKDQINLITYLPIKSISNDILFKSI